MPLQRAEARTRGIEQHGAKVFDKAGGQFPCGVELFSFEIENAQPLAQFVHRAQPMRVEITGDDACVFRQQGRKQRRLAAGRGTEVKILRIAANF